MTSRADIQRESCHDESGSVVYLHLNVWFRDPRTALGPTGSGTWILGLGLVRILPFVVAFEHFDNI